MLHRAGSSPLTRGKPGDELSDLRPRGPSPLTRGKHSLAAPNAPPGGLIPAHAGKTRHTLCPSSSGTAHPRSRGENSNAADRSTPAGGSSPLTRGKLVEGARLFDVVGLIPAHAGKTPLVSHRAISRPAHPRSRGETSTRRESRLPFGAHPRSRGENPIRSRTLAAASGASPLTRGKPGAGLELDLRPRLIPAHAGKTSSS